MSHRFASDRGATIAGRKEAYPHLLCNWSTDPASRRLSRIWAPPAKSREKRRELPVLVFSPRLVPDDAILISEPA